MQSDLVSSFSNVFYGIDYNELLSEFEEICSRVLPDWDVQNESDDLVKVSRLWLQALSRSNKFVSTLIQETNPQTMRDLRSIQAWLNAFGVRTYTRQPAVAMILLNYTTESDKVINPYELELTVTTDANITLSFFNISTIVLKASRERTVALFSEGLCFFETYVYNNEDSITLSQRYFTDELFIKKSAYVKVNGVLWHRVTDSQTFNNAATLYDIVVDSTEQARIVFGSSISGMKPEVGSIIEVFYRINFGTQGNVTATYENGKPTKEFFVRNTEKFPYITNAYLMQNTSGAADTPSIRELRKILNSGINLGGQLNNSDDVNRYLLTLPGIKQARTDTNTFIINSTIVIDYFSDTLKNTLESQIQAKLPSLFSIIILPAKFSIKNFIIFVRKTQFASEQYVINEIKNKFRLFLDYSSIDPNTKLYYNPIGGIVYLSALAYMIKSIKGIYDYEINVYSSDNKLIASSLSKENVKPFYFNEADTVTSVDSNLDIILQN